MLETHLKYTFKNRKLLKQALVHRSYSQDNNERLEFLGDGCLNFVIGERLYQIQPSANEGELSNLRSHLVKEETLATISLSLNINEYVVLSQGERKNDGAKRPSLLADVLEAIIGAIYLDSGFQMAQSIILDLYKPYLKEIEEQPAIKINELFKDPKSRLQERLQALNRETPIYRVDSVSGRDHEKLFKVICIFEEHETTAEGTSKKRAEQQAAQLMLDKIS